MIQHSLKPRPVVKVDKLTGEILDEYPSLNKAIVYTGNMSMQRICMSKTLQPKPYLYRFKDQYDRREVFVTRENIPVAVVKDCKLEYVAFSIKAIARRMIYAVDSIEKAILKGYAVNGYYFIRLRYIGALYDLFDKDWKLMDTKYCNGCMQELPVSAFATNKGTKDHLQVYCRKCMGIYTKHSNYKRDFTDKAHAVAPISVVDKAYLIPSDEEIRARALGRGYYD